MNSLVLFLFFNFAAVEVFIEAGRQTPTEQKFTPRRKMKQAERAPAMVKLDGDSELEPHVNSDLVKIDNALAEANPDLRPIVRGHGIEISKLQKSEAHQDAALQKNAVDIEANKYRIGKVAEDLEESVNEANENFKNIKKVEDDHQERINSLNEYANILDVEQQAQGSKIAAVDAEQKTNQIETNKRLDKHQDHLKGLDLKFGDFEVKTNEMGKVVGSNTEQIRSLQNEHAATKNTVKGHGEDISRIDGVIRKNLKEFDEYKIGQQAQGKAIKEGEIKFAKFMDEDFDRHKNIGIQFGTIGNALEGLGKTQKEHGNIIGQHGGDIKQLQTDVDAEKKVRSEGQEAFEKQQKAQGILIENHGSKLKEQGKKHSELEKEVGTLNGTVKTFREDYDKKVVEDKENNEAHARGIKGNAEEIGKLQGTTKEHEEKLEKTKTKIENLEGDFGETKMVVGKHGQILKGHTGELSQNKEEFGRIRSKLTAHGKKLEKGESENRKRVEEIQGVQKNLNEESRKIYSAIEETNGDIGKNRVEIGKNRDQLNGQNGRLQKVEADSVVFGQKLKRHDGRFDEHGILLKDYEGRFKQQQAESEVILEGQKKINEAIMDAEKAMGSQFLESEKQMLRATQKAVENAENALKVIEQKMFVIEEAQKAQTELLKTHIIKEAAKNNDTPTNFIVEKMEETAIAAQEEAEEQIGIVQN